MSPAYSINRIKSSCSKFSQNLKTIYIYIIAKFVPVLITLMNIVDYIFPHLEMHCHCWEAIFFCFFTRFTHTNTNLSLSNVDSL